jgi:hypothetical protein
MKNILRMVLGWSLVLVGSAQAGNTVETQIHDLIGGNADGIGKVLSQADGRVYRLQTQSLQWPILEDARKSQSWVKLEVSEKGEILSVARIAAPQQDESDEIEKSLIDMGPQNQTFAPSRFRSVAEVTRLFNGLENNHRKRSQCFQRAMLWSYGLWANRGIHTVKLFMFFTREYIQRYNYDWWFHVTPAVYVGDDIYTIDRTFTDRPLTLKEWTDSFIESKRACPIITHYREYESRPYGEHCLIRAVPMYHYQPADIETSDTTGIPRTRFLSGDIEAAKGARRRFGLE